MVYDLIASHGDVEDLVFFAVLMQGKTYLGLVGIWLQLSIFLRGIVRKIRP